MVGTQGLNLLYMHLQNRLGNWLFILAGNLMIRTIFQPNWVTKWCGIVLGMLVVSKWTFPRMNLHHQNLFILLCHNLLLPKVNINKLRPIQISLSVHKKNKTFTTKNIASSLEPINILDNVVEDTERKKRQKVLFLCECPRAKKQVTRRTSSKVPIRLRLQDERLIVWTNRRIFPHLNILGRRH